MCLDQDIWHKCFITHKDPTQPTCMLCVLKICRMIGQEEWGGCHPTLYHIQSILKYIGLCTYSIIVLYRFSSKRKFNLRQKTSRPIESNENRPPTTKCFKFSRVQKMQVLLDLFAK